MGLVTEKFPLPSNCELAFVIHWLKGRVRLVLVRTENVPLIEPLVPLNTKFVPDNTTLAKTG